MAFDDGRLVLVIESDSGHVVGEPVGNVGITGRALDERLYQSWRVVYPCERPEPGVDDRVRHQADHGIREHGVRTHVVGHVHQRKPWLHHPATEGHD